ncbi:MAG: hypothetical protein GKS02_00470 [Alphaproteobacteria bacterium]|nr:hypothetical protein [Alphaproteobacteria bacterium]
MSRLLILLAAATFFLAPNSGAIAAEPVQLTQNNTVIEKVFNDLERKVIREVLGGADIQDVEADQGKRGKKGKGSKGAPPGLAKRDSLPPGLEKKNFPAHLRSQLPAPLQGTQRVLVGNDAVLIDTATNIVLDVIRDVVRNR